MTCPRPPKELVLHANGQITLRDGSDPAEYLCRLANEAPGLQFPVAVNVVDHQTLDQLVFLANCNTCA